MTNEADELVVRLRAAASEAGTCVVSDAIFSENSNAPEIFVTVDDAVALMIKVQPPALYLDVGYFRLDDAMDEARDELGLAEVQELPSSIKAAGERLKQFEGQPCWATGNFFVSSAIHTVIGVAGWLRDFNASIEILKDDQAARAADRLQHASKEQEAHIEELAELLLHHPSFTFGRPSAAKRFTLAKELFDSTDEQLLYRAVDRAEHLLWLDQSGFKRSNG